MKILFKRLLDVEKKDLIDLMNHPLVRRHLPLLEGIFDEKACDAFIKTKEQIWSDYGYGPWAFVKNDQLIGWGGLQPDEGNVEIALVLHPNHWGRGKELLHLILDFAFDQLQLDSVTILLPPTRTRIRGLLQRGFIFEEKTLIEEKLFFRYRISK